ncbi:oligosaccharide flippase family protein [Sinomonas sp. ASV486]|uniref:Oligosaccharide flippase family protein n=1 Tax=Sinomonas puerhi TaxID=3238584 RepID=A0AB39L8H3_9MICC|nr:oligosaccharide flippase family protein [Sinomonas sp. ASV486]MDQ4490349.1 oligosaccharide flippase family protein [Sinomonas sp. ASV486]
MGRRVRWKQRRTSVSVGSGAVWSGLNTIVMKASNIAVTVVVVRLVSPHDFGVFTAALVAGTIATAICELGVASTLIRRDLDLGRLAPTVVAIAWVWAVLLAVVMASAAEPIGIVLGSSEAAEPIRVLALGVALSGFSAVPGSLLARGFKQGSLFLASALAFVPSSALLLFLASGGAGAMAFAWSKVVGGLVSATAMAIFARRWFWPRFDRVAFAEVLRIGIPLAGANLIGYVLLNADFALVGHSLGPAQLGIYSVAFTVSSLSVSVLSSVLNSVAMPAFSEHAGDPAGIRSSVGKWLHAVFLMGAPVCGLTMAFSHEIISVLYGTSWAPAAAVVGILALYGIPMLVELMMSNLLVALGKTGTVLLVQGVWLVVLGLAMAVGLQLVGLTGVAWAHVAVLLGVVLPLQVGLLTRALPRVLAGLWKLAIRPMVATVAAAAIGTALAIPMPTDASRLFVGGAAAALVYAGGLRREWAVYLPALRPGRSALREEA